MNKEDKDGENKKNTTNDTWSYNDILGYYYYNSKGLYLNNIIPIGGGGVRKKMI